MSNFTHLHTHSHYSLLTALPKIDDLVKQAKKYSMKSLAITDNGNLYGAIEFYKTCQKAEIKPIIGVDFYVAVRSRKDMQAGIDNRRTRLVMLALNNKGYKNLIKLVTDSHLEGFYYKPRIDKELIQKYQEGIIAISPSFSGEIVQALKSRNQDKAIEIANYYKQIADFSVYDRIDGNVTLLRPENRFYLIEKRISQESDIFSYLTHDIYAVLNRVDDDIIHAKIYYRPLISFIWLSVLLMFCGLLLPLI
jgi:DNA polymerase III alpha subunit